MERFDAMLREWTISLVPREKKGLMDCGAGIFIGLRQVRMEEGFLDACLELWDPSYHVFRFPGGEICPLVEEFAAIAGWDKRLLPVVLHAELGYKNKFRDYLMLTKTEVDHLFLGNQVSMLRVASKFVNRNDQTISPAARRRALSFCLMQRFAFTGIMGDSALGDPRILCVVEQMELGRNPAPLILAETLVGLDDRLGSRMHGYRGCPRILQVWLMERLNVLASVDNASTYRPNGVVSRAVTWIGPHGRPNDYFPRFVRTRMLRWVVPWWNIRDFGASSVLDASSGLMLCGLELGIWIHPLRIRRQMGLAQVIPRDDTRIQTPVVLTDRVVDDWALRWGNRATWCMPDIRETIWVSRAYIRWTTSGDSREKNQLRAEEKLDISQRKLQVQGNIEVGPSRAPPLGKRKIMDVPRKATAGPVRGVPLSESVFGRLGDNSVSRGMAKGGKQKVFDRLGQTSGWMDDYLKRVEGDNVKKVVCGLKSKVVSKVGPSKPKYVVKSEVTAPRSSSKEKEDMSDEDVNPKRKK